MKRLLTTLSLCLLAALPHGIHAQADSASARIVDRYLGILNIDALPQDSLLVLTTTITTSGSDDTVVMQRLFQPPQMFRVDVRDSRGLQTGLCSNGKDRFRAYSEINGWWGDITPESFHRRLTGFDFRGPLYNWRSTNPVMTYLGKVTVEQRNVQLDAVRVEVEGNYTRIYMFEESGLLSVIVEQDNSIDPKRVLEDTHIQWKCEHEYDKVGPTVLPSLESFMRDGRLTVLSTEMHLEPRNNLKFNQD